METFKKQIRKETDNGDVDEKFKGFDFKLFSYDNVGSDFLNVEDIDEAFQKEIPKETDGENGEKSKEKINKIFKLEIPKVIGKEMGENSQENFGFKRTKYY
ncbi:PREDICTED: uncharacterized protein LOC109169198 [Ipomoea nil]|uniref:uncharacterized protein LOC109169198 n=1 Tax=Ipomoea nil TaxID=35883 RepID=UPI000901170F|nr:PREDICTED: uncharacterized protein LOC109169198 [Ipomoea nil]